MRTRQVVTTTLALLAVVAVAAGATLWLTRSNDEPTDTATRVEWYRRSADGFALTVGVTLGVDVTVTLLRFEERDDQIVVTVRMRRPVLGDRIDIPAVGLGYVITAGLLRPIGTRTVVDGSSGDTVPEAPR
jgi:hypothetical protein